MHWNWIYHLPTHACFSACFSHLGGEEIPPFPKPETQGLSLTLLFPSPTLSHQVLMISLHGYVSSPSPSFLSWLPNSGFHFSFCIIATAIDLLASPPNLSNPYCIQNHLSNHVTPFEKDFQWFLTSYQAKSKILSMANKTIQDLLCLQPYFASPLGLWKARVCSCKFTKLVTLLYPECLCLMFSPSWKIFLPAPLLNFSMYSSRLSLETISSGKLPSARLICSLRVMLRSHDLTHHSVE